MWHTGTITRQIPELARAAGPARFEINPADAHRLGVAEGDPVEVRSRFGAGPGLGRPQRRAPPGRPVRRLLRPGPADQPRGGRPLRPDVQRARVQGDGRGRPQGDGLTAGRIRPLDNLELVTIVKVLGSLACAVGLLACIRLLRFRPADFASNRAVHLGFVTLSTVAFYKLIAFAAFFAVPAAGLTLANYHLMEGTHETMSCMQCHVMWPMGNDLRDPDSQNLAARHARNKWIPERQCFQCHVNYALAGSLESKMDGYRHLSRYTSKTYPEPIQYPGPLQQPQLPALPRRDQELRGGQVAPDRPGAPGRQLGELPELPRPGPSQPGAADPRPPRLREVDGGDPQMNLKWEAWGGIIAFAITLWFVIDPSPYPMVLFAFFAQPLFLVVGVFYLAKVIRDLRNQRIL